MDNKLLELVGKRLGDITDLPEALKKELQATKSNELESRIIKVVDEVYDGAANIDEILIGLYRKFNLMLKRQFLTNKIYRMTKSELLFPVKGRKGVYVTKQIDL